MSGRKVSFSGHGHFCVNLEIIIIIISIRRFSIICIIYYSNYYLSLKLLSLL